MSHENPAYYAIIPANVRYDKRLKAMERILYGEITALANKMGYCTAKNKYFGDLYDVHQNTAGGWINRLEKFGYIRTELIYDGKQIIGRRIYISDAIPSTGNRKNTEANLDDLNEKIDTPVNEKIDTPVNEKIDTLSTKRLKINNTRLNNTRLNNSFVGDAETSIADEAETKTEQEENSIVETDSFVAAEATTQSPNLAGRKSKTSAADNRKRFAAIAEVFNAVFADCPAVQKVNLAKVTLEDGKTVDTKTNMNRMKLVPYAWGIARQRVQTWEDADGLIDGEQPSGKHCLQWFENYFRNCKGEGFINGSQPRSAAHENWKPKFENLLKPEWIEQRVFEGD